MRVKDLVPEEVWRPRYGIINDFERTLTAGGITVLKFFLYISKDEQRRRLQARLDDRRSAGSSPATTSRSGRSGTPTRPPSRTP